VQLGPQLGIAVCHVRFWMLRRRMRLAANRALSCQNTSIAIESHHIPRRRVARDGERLAGVRGQGCLGGGLGRFEGRGRTGGDERGALRAAEQFPADLGWESIRSGQVKRNQLVTVIEPMFGAIGRPEFRVGVPADGRIFSVQRHRSLLRLRLPN
jgi:hypothetical protein